MEDDTRKSKPLMVTLGLMVSFVIVCACIIVFLIVTKTFNKRKKLEEKVRVVEEGGGGGDGGDGSMINMEAEIEPVPLSVVRRDSEGGVKGTTIHTDKIEPLPDDLLGADGEPSIEINGLMLKKKSASEYVFETDQDEWKLNGYVFQKNGTSGVYTFRAPSGKTVVQGIQIDDSNSSRVTINPSDSNKDVSINGIAFNQVSPTLYQIQPGVSNLELNGMIFRNRSTEIELDTQGKDLVINGTKFKDGEMDTGDDTFVLQDVNFTRVGTDKYSIDVPNRELTLQDLTMDRSDPTHYSIHADGKDMIVNGLRLEHVSGTVYRLDAGGKALDLNGTLFHRVSPTLYEIDPQSSDLRLNGLVLNNSDVDYYTIEVAGKNIELNGLRLQKVGTNEFRIEPVGRTDLNLNGLLLKQVDANTYSIGAEGKDIDLNGALFSQVGTDTYKIDPQGKDLNLNGLILRQVDADTYEIDAQRDDVNFNGLLFSRSDFDNVYRIDPQGLDLDLNGAIFKKIAPNQYQIDVQGRIMNIDGGIFYSLDEFTYMIDPGGKILQFNGVKVQQDEITGETNIFTDTKRLFIQDAMFEDVDVNTFAIHPGTNKSVLMLNGLTFDNSDEHRYDINTPDEKSLNLNGLDINDSETFLNLRSDENKTMVLSGLEIDDISAVQEVFIRTIIPDQTIVFEEDVVVSKVLKVSEIAEETPDAGVMIDDVLLKDGLVDNIDIAEMGNVVSQVQTSVEEIETDLSGFPQQLKNLTVGEIQQLENIGTSAISQIQWVYLSQQDQSISSSSNVGFGSVTTNILSVDMIEPISPSQVVDINSVEIGNGTVDGVDIAAFYLNYVDLQQEVDNDLGFPAELKNLTTFEIQQLGNIGFNAVSSTQWNHLSTLDQSLDSTSSPEFASITTSSIVPLVDDVEVGGVPIGSGLVDGVDVAQLYQDFLNLEGGFPTELKDLTPFEILQLQNINANPISETQWNYLSTLDQSLDSTSSPEFASITTSSIVPLVDDVEVGGVPIGSGLVDGVDVAQLYQDFLDLEGGFPTELKDLTPFEILQLQNINSSSITETQWGYLSTSDQTLSTSSSPEFASIFTDTISDITGDGVQVGGVSMKDGLVENVNIAQFYQDFLDLEGGFPTELKDLTPFEILQLQNINENPITETQWSYLSALDQSLSIASSPTFTSLFTDTISDVTGSGVTIDGVLFQDGLVNGIDLSSLATSGDLQNVADTTVRTTGDQHNIQGVKGFRVGISTSVINELVLDAGVTIDGVLLQDGQVNGVDISALGSMVDDHELRLDDLEPLVSTHTGQIDTLDTTTMKLSGDQTATGLKTYNDLVRNYGGIDVSVVRSTNNTWPMNLRAADTTNRDQIVRFQSPSGTNAWYWTLDKSSEQHIYLGRAAQDWTTFQFRTSGDFRASTFNGVDINALNDTVTNLDTDLDNTVVRLTGDQTVADVKTFTSPIKIDAIDENTPGAGITIDGVLLKDGYVEMSANILRFNNQAGTRLEQVAGTGIRFWRGTAGTLGPGVDDRIASLYDGYLGLYRTGTQMRFHDPADTTKNTYFDVPVPSDTATTHTITFPSSSSTLATTDDISSLDSEVVKKTGDQTIAGIKTTTDLFNANGGIIGKGISYLDRVGINVPSSTNLSYALTVRGRDSGNYRSLLASLFRFNGTTPQWNMLLSSTNDLQFDSSDTTSALRATKAGEFYATQLNATDSVKAKNILIGDTLTNSPAADLHIQNKQDVVIWLESDSDNITETDNPMIRMTQDGGLLMSEQGWDSGNKFNYVKLYSTSSVLSQQRFSVFTGGTVTSGARVGIVPTVSGGAENFYVNHVGDVYGKRIVTDNIVEKTLDAGVTIDGVNIKEGKLNNMDIVDIDTRLSGLENGFPGAMDQGVGIYDTPTFLGINFSGNGAMITWNPPLGRGKRNVRLGIDTLDDDEFDYFIPNIQNECRFVMTKTHNYDMDQVVGNINFRLSSLENSSGGSIYFLIETAERFDLDPNGVLYQQIPFNNPTYSGGDGFTWNNATSTLTFLHTGIFLLTCSASVRGDSSSTARATILASVYDGTRTTNYSRIGYIIPEQGNSHPGLSQHIYAVSGSTLTVEISRNPITDGGYIRHRSLGLHLIQPL